MSEAAAETLTQAWSRLARTCQSLLAEIDRALKQAGLPPFAWYEILIELNRAGHDGLRPFELTERLPIAQYNISRLLDRLEEAELIERFACTSDARGQIARITREGQRTCRRIWAVYEPVLESRLGAKLTPAELQEFARLLGRLISG